MSFLLFNFRIMPNITNLQHIITSEQFTKEYLEELFIIADKIKENKGKYSKSLEGKVMAILFYEPSTRTRSSFDVAVKRL
jgi:aspartate carbamoyltransferase catalytic subunit